MNSFVFLRRPEVPGFCPAIGAELTTEGFRGPSPTSLLTSSSASSIFPETYFASSLVLVIETAPIKRVDRPIRIFPFTVRRSQPTRDGTPSEVASSRACTILNFLLSSEITGAFPPQAGLRTGRKSSVMMYASERRRRRSLHFFTGAKRVRGTMTADAPSKHSIAAPMAVSSWTTFWDESSFGSTVLLFLIMGSGMKPPHLSTISCSLSKRIQRLFVLKNLCLVISWKSFSSSSAHMADSRRIRCLSSFLIARWPPFLSFSVRSQHSIMNEASVVAKWVRIFRSRVAPRLSEFETNMYLKPPFRSAARRPEPIRAA
mmetsp:Transcript_38477/g.86685  ORF Transcript_38477/g.86685 Transcript_38477/m.86685 type:complete len:316 (-) Transcript_38477:315-1262(-)